LIPVLHVCKFLAELLTVFIFRRFARLDSSWLVSWVLVSPKMGFSINRLKDHDLLKSHGVHYIYEISGSPKE